MDKNLRNDEVIRISNEILKQKNYNISLYDLIKKMIKKDYINDIDKITYDITKN